MDTTQVVAGNREKVESEDHLAFQFKISPVLEMHDIAEDPASSSFNFAANVWKIEMNPTGSSLALLLSTKVLIFPSSIFEETLSNRFAVVERENRKEPVICYLDEAFKSGPGEKSRLCWSLDGSLIATIDGFGRYLLLCDEQGNILAKSEIPKQKWKMPESIGCVALFPVHFSQVGNPSSTNRDQQFVLIWEDSTRAVISFSPENNSLAIQHRSQPISNTSISITWIEPCTALATNGSDTLIALVYRESTLKRSIQAHDGDANKETLVIFSDLSQLLSWQSSLRLQLCNKKWPLEMNNQSTLHRYISQISKMSIGANFGYTTKSDRCPLVQLVCNPSKRFVDRLFYPSSPAVLTIIILFIFQ